MALTVYFSDGFTSASAPTGVPSIESFTIANNQIAGAVATYDQATSKTVFLDYEVRRETSLGVFIQSGNIILNYDGAWSLSYGNYMGNEILVDTIANTEHVKLTLNSATGALTYDSGNMSGTSYVGTIKMNTTRIS